MSLAEASTFTHLNGKAREAAPSKGTRAGVRGAKTIAIAIITQIGQGNRAVSVQWALYNTDTDGDPVQLTDFSRGSVTFDYEVGSARATLQGSNDGVTFFDMTDVHKDLITSVSASISFQEFGLAPRWIRPVLTSVSGTTAFVITVTVSQV